MLSLVLKRLYSTRFRQAKVRSGVEPEINIFIDYKIPPNKLHPIIIRRTMEFVRVARRRDPPSRITLDAWITRVHQRLRAWYAGRGRRLLIGRVHYIRCTGPPFVARII